MILIEVQKNRFFCKAGLNSKFYNRLSGNQDFSQQSSTVLSLSLYTLCLSVSLSISLSFSFFVYAVCLSLYLSLYLCFFLHDLSFWLDMTSFGNDYESPCKSYSLGEAEFWACCSRFLDPLDWEYPCWNRYYFVRLIFKSSLPHWTHLTFWIFEIVYDLINYSFLSIKLIFFNHFLCKKNGWNVL